LSKAENGPTFTYAYNDTVHKHEVTPLNGLQDYWYDANGNMTKCIEGRMSLRLNCFTLTPRNNSATQLN
jgi:hypothetical protein